MTGIPDLTQAMPSALQRSGNAASSRKPQALVSFVLLTFGLSWGLGWLSTIIAPTTPLLAAALFTVCGFGPSLAAFITVLSFDGFAGLRDWLGRCLRWRLHLVWYALAFLAPLLVMLAALGIHWLLGGTLPESPVAGNLGLAISTFSLVLLIGGPLSEEFGWRGYALPVLTSRFGWRSASLLIGVTWGLWHAPLFLMDGTVQAEMPFLLFFIGTVAMSVVFARLAVNTSFSVMPAIALHWSINAGAWAIPVTPQGGVLQPFVLVTGLQCLVAAVAFIKPGPAKARMNRLSDNDEVGKAASPGDLRQADHRVDIRPVGSPGQQRNAK